MAKKGCIPWNKGKSKADDSRIKSPTNGDWGKWSGKNHSDATKQKMSVSKKILYETGWEPICGRSRKYDYESPIAGKIKLDGTWEVIAARHLDSLGVTWERNRKRFKYNHPKGGVSTYQPDFYVKEWDSYVEVKGYKTDIDEAKWEQFPHKLIVWQKAKIRELERGQDGNAAHC